MVAATTEAFPASGSGVDCLVMVMVLPVGAAMVLELIAWGAVEEF